MVLLVIIGIVVAVTLSYLWVKFVMWMFSFLLPKENKSVIENPYIKAQLIKDKNDRDYEEYLKWMEKHSSGVPFQKIMSREDFEAEKKIKNLF